MTETTALPAGLSPLPTPQQVVTAQPVGRPDPFAPLPATASNGSSGPAAPVVPQGFRFHWKARITQRVEAQQLHWESVGGLPTKGAVRFYPQGPRLTAVKLSVSYELPGALAPLMEPTMLGGMVTKELQANLDRFRDLVESDPAASPADGGLSDPA